MNSDYVTALRVQQHQADLLREAEQHRRARAGRRVRLARSRHRWIAPWRRRQTLPSCQPEIAGA